MFTLFESYEIEKQSTTISGVSLFFFASFPISLQICVQHLMFSDGRISIENQQQHLITSTSDQFHFF